jgi:membrane protein implicated in regulation of membrane protease activity
VIPLGLTLLAVALVLLLAEAHLSTGGMIASGAILALVCGVTLLLIGAAAGLPTVLAVSTGGSVAAVGGVALLGRSIGMVGRSRPRAGAEAMVGHLGVVRAGSRGAKVFVDGALWRAQPSVLDEGNALHDGDRVVVERINGLTLHVRKADELELN